MNPSDSERFMVPRRGFEPRFTASKAAVLPLDDLGVLLDCRDRGMAGGYRATPLRSWRTTEGCARGGLVRRSLSIFSLTTIG